MERCSEKRAAGKCAQASAGTVRWWNLRAGTDESPHGVGVETHRPIHTGVVMLILPWPAVKWCSRHVAVSVAKDEDMLAFFPTLS